MVPPRVRFSVVSVGRGSSGEPAHTELVDVSNHDASINAVFDTALPLHTSYFRPSPLYLILLVKISVH